MRTLGIFAATIVGGFAGMLAASLLLGGLGANESAQAVGTFLGAVVGGVGLAVLVARLVPPSPRSLERGQRILKGRDQRVIGRR